MNLVIDQNMTEPTDLSIYLENYYRLYDKLLRQKSDNFGGPFHDCKSLDGDRDEYYFNEKICLWIDENMSGAVSNPTWHHERPYDQKFQVLFENIEDKLAFQMRWL
jgi:hypothetical protein